MYIKIKRVIFLFSITFLLILYILFFHTGVLSPILNNSSFLLANRINVELGTMEGNLFSGLIFEKLKIKINPGIYINIDKASFKSNFSFLINLYKYNSIDLSCLDFLLLEDILLKNDNFELNADFFS